MKRFKNLHIFIRIGAVVFVLGLILLGIGMARQSSNQAKLDRFPVLTDEASVRDALWGSPKTYILLNVPLTGDPCEDPMGLLQQEYVCLEYRSYYFVSRERQNDSGSYVSTWDWSDTITRNGSNLMIYGDIPLTTKGYTPHNPTISLGSDTVKEGYVNKLYTDGITSTSFYYPDAIGDFENNVRYQLSGIRQGAEVAMLAKLGNGIAALTSLQNEEAPPISGYNDLSSLEYTQDESVGALALAGFAALVVGIVLAVMGVIDAVSNPTVRTQDGKRGSKSAKSTKSAKKRKK